VPNLLSCFPDSRGLPRSLSPILSSACRGRFFGLPRKSLMTCGALRLFFKGVFDGSGPFGRGFSAARSFSGRFGILLSFFPQGGRPLRRSQLNARPPGLGEADRNGLLGRTRVMARHVCPSERDGFLRAQILPLAWKVTFLPACLPRLVPTSLGQASRPPFGSPYHAALRGAALSWACLFCRIRFDNSSLAFSNAVRRSRVRTRPARFMK
jgi:hypothetical protein